MANRDAGSILVRKMIVLAYTQQQFLVLWSPCRPGVVEGLGTRRHISPFPHLSPQQVAIPGRLRSAIPLPRTPEGLTHASPRSGEQRAKELVWTLRPTIVGKSL